MFILLRAVSTRKTKAVDASPGYGCIPKNCSSIYSLDNPNYSSTSSTNCRHEWNGPDTCCHPRAPRM